MRHVTQWSMIFILCLFGTQQGQAQGIACGDSKACVADNAAIAGLGRDSSIQGTNQPKLEGQERCAAAPVDVTAASPDERRFACSAASEALRLLARCGISPRGPLHVQIMSEVRHPFGPETGYSLPV